MTDVKRDKPKYPKQKLNLSLDIPPSVNHCYVAGRMNILTKDAQRYIINVQNIIKSEIKAQGFKLDLDSVWYYVDMVFYMPDRRIRDTHNTFKILFDSIQGSTFFKNDYFLMPRVLHVAYDKEKPRVELTIFAERFNES